MTRTAKRTGIVAAVFAVIIACALLIATQTAYADGANGEIKYGKKMTVSNKVYSATINLGSKDNGAKDITIKSSKKKVAGPSYYDKSQNYLMLMINKKGTTKLTFKVKKKSGTKTYKGTLKVIAYKNPVKKLTLGGKNITKKFKNDTYYAFQPSDKAKEKIVVKAAKGWKVKKITHSYMNNSFTKFYQKKVKNGGTVKWAKNDSDTVTVTMYNKSRNQTELLMISPEFGYEE